MNWHKYFFSTPHKSCLFCGSFFISSAMICETCEQHLLELCDLQVRRQGQILHRYLIRWNQNSDYIVRKAARLFKGHQAALWKHLAQLFFDRHGKDQKLNYKTGFVAAPARPKNEDHSSQFARALADIYGQEYLGRPLLKTSPDEQKILGRRQRQQRQYVKNTGWSPSETQRVILADDILTTGHTAQALKNEFSHETIFEVWTIFWRESEASRPR